MLVFTQPVAGLQESAVQAFLSSQLIAVWTQPLAALQVSVVQALLSSQLIAVKTQPANGSHVSVVQTLLSLQTLAAPGTQTPPEQASPTVQALPSEQNAVLLVNTHAPVVVLQESVVHTLLSLQTLAAPGTQAPAEQASFSVQALPSEQAAVLLVNTHAPVAGLQESSVQTLLSLQTLAVPTQTLFKQASPVVQALPSEHSVPLGCPTHEVQFGLTVPAHTPPEHTSLSVQPLPS